MTPNDHFNEILGKQEELAARCRQNPRGLGETLPQLAELQTQLRSLEALPAGPERTERITELFQEFAVLLEEVEQCHGILTSMVGGTLHAPARDYDLQGFFQALDLIRNTFQEADALLASPGQASSAAAPGAQDTPQKKDQE